MNSLYNYTRKKISKERTKEKLKTTMKKISNETQ